MCNENTLSNAVWEEMDVDPDDPPTTILRPGATKKQIAECEARLGHDLPDDFREFLSLTNGMDSIWNGFYGEPKLLGTDEIYVFDASELQDGWQNASVQMKFIPDMSVKPEWTTLDRVLMINDGADDSKYLWLLEPELGRQYAGSFFAAYQALPLHEQEQVRSVLQIFHAGKENASEINWQTCVWSPPTLEAQGYQTFREYLEIMAGDTANDDILEEEDDQGRLLHSHDIFAYQLR
ncbi:hypothetical protein K491DRAFT_688686 [Lophiostoma macrostomum CBS 122681]|uniref:Knr4/Smi1-like domain-containing protein n=1 Tax=Lophiostoma macrostomum CBS 122681 TaxID=1314788 RepID=A0A6A6TNA5_9PLEO|nr:hypothetical protein K491DRAFT_688686 [Lophiostoma macrostomum CBS 122681]